MRHFFPNDENLQVANRHIDTDKLIVIIKAKNHNFLQENVQRLCNKLFIANENMHIIYLAEYGDSRTRIIRFYNTYVAIIDPVRASLITGS